MIEEGYEMNSVYIMFVGRCINSFFLVSFASFRVYLLFHFKNTLTKINQSIIQTIMHHLLEYQSEQSTWSIINLILSYVQVDSLTKIIWSVAAYYYQM